MVILENIDKAILQNIDIDKISNRFKFCTSNRARGYMIIMMTIVIAMVEMMLIKGMTLLTTPFK